MTFVTHDSSPANAIHTAHTQPMLQRLAKLALLTSLTGLLAVPAISQAANPFKYVGSIISTRNTSGDRTDFHVELKTDTEMTFSKGMLEAPDGSFFAPTGISGNGTRTMNLDWTISTKQKQSVRFQVGVLEKEYNQINFRAWYTPKASPTDIPGLGWRVEGNGNVFLTNEYDATVQFSGLAFSSSKTFTDTTLSSLIDGNRSGSVGLMTAGIVGAKADLYVGHFAGPFVQNYLYAVFDTSFVDQGFSAETSSIALVHEVPEPSSVALMVTGLAGLMGVRRRQIGKGLQTFRRSEPAP